MSGTGFFETMLLHEGALPLSHLHRDRFLHAAHLFAFPFTWAGIAAGIRQRLPAPDASARVRVSAYCTEAGPVLDIHLQPFSFAPASGWTAEIYPAEKVQPAPPYGLKRLPYSLWERAARWADTEGWNEALLLNPSGRIAEGGRTNLFLFRNGRWYTPPLSEGGVAGVMRRHLLSLLQASGTPVIEAPIAPEDLRSAEGAALTNALRGAIPLTRFGGTALDPAPALRLQELLRPTFPKPLC